MALQHSRPRSLLGEELNEARCSDQRPWPMSMARHGGFELGLVARVRLEKPSLPPVLKTPFIDLLKQERAILGLHERG